MESAKLNTEVMEAKERTQAYPDRDEGDVLDAFYDYYDYKLHMEARRKMEDYAECLFDCIKESLDGDGDPYLNDCTKNVLAWGSYLIDKAPWYNDNPDHISGSISKDFWKGYVLGFERGHHEACIRHRTDIVLFEPEYDDPDNCIIIPESGITSVFDELECEHGITVRYLPDDEYLVFMETWLHNGTEDSTT